MMRNVAVIATVHARASRAALAALTGLSAFVFVITAAAVAERQQERADLIMQESLASHGAGR
ncbi:hypothetical protein ACLE20_06865 [Rhizobium sp. YIM 134829]|uniref:hypothetical protein n=1 Tax=Rhizobium sp. YIM 134829 TaxID=3390453 RepID=UPI00397C4DB0